MKAFHALLLLMLIYIVKTDVDGFKEKLCSDYAPNQKPAFSLDFCRSTNYGDDGIVKCCFLKLERNNQRLYHCQPINATVWSDIEILEKSLESQGYDVVKIDCGSSYLYASLLVLLALIF